MSEQNLSRVRAQILLAWLATLAGIAAAVHDLETLGAWLTVAGALAQAYLLHRFGRLGPDPAAGPGGKGDSDLSDDSPGAAPG